MNHKQRGDETEIIRPGAAGRVRVGAHGVGTGRPGHDYGCDPGPVGRGDRQRQRDPRQPGHGPGAQDQIERIGPIFFPSGKDRQLQRDCQCAGLWDHHADRLEAGYAATVERCGHAEAGLRQRNHCGDGECPAAADAGELDRAGDGRPIHRQGAAQRRKLGLHRAVGGGRGSTAGHAWRRHRRFQLQWAARGTEQLHAERGGQQQPLGRLPYRGQLRGAASVGRRWRSSRCRAATTRRSSGTRQAR